MTVARKHRVRVHDGGFASSLKKARIVCAAFTVFPVLFAAISAVYISRGGPTVDQPILLIGLAAIGAVIAPAAPRLRAQIARIGVTERVAGNPAYRNPRALYSILAAASIAGFLVAEIVSLLGFVATVLTRTMSPLYVGSAASYITWLFLWPRRGEWRRLAEEAGIGVDDYHDELAEPQPAEPEPSEPGPAEDPR